MAAMKSDSESWVKHFFRKDCMPVYMGDVEQRDDGKWYGWVEEDGLNEEAEIGPFDTEAEAWAGCEEDAIARIERGD